MHRALVGGQLQRVAVAHIAGREVAVLKVRLPPPPPPLTPSLRLETDAGDTSGESVYVVLAAGAGLGVVDPAGRARLRNAMQYGTSPSQAGWRSRIEGARVVAIVGDVAEGMALLRDGQPWRAFAPVGKRETALRLSAEALSDSVDMTRDALSERGARIVEELVQTTIAARRQAVRRALDKALARIEKRIAAVRGDLDRIGMAEAKALLARLFVPEAARAPRGLTKLEAVDWSTGEARQVELRLDPQRGAKEQIDALFKRARRLKDGARIAQARLSEAETARDALRAIADSQRDDIDADLEALESRAKAVAPRDFKPTHAIARAGAPSPSPAPTAARQPPYRTFIGASGPPILVGRGAAHNDTLTFRVARPHDLWLHAKGWAGAHVVVPLRKGASCPADLLVEAAHLAAHFSDARDEGLVEVQYTARRYLRKPRGSAPGLVVVDREKVIVLRREDAIIRALLEREVTR